LPEHKKREPTSKGERYNPLREIFKRDKDSLKEKVHKIDASKGDWWTYELKGAASIAFGAVLIAWPEETLLFLIVAFGIQALFKGVVGLVHAIQLAKRGDRWSLVLLESGIGLVLGVALIAQPSSSIRTVAVLVGIWMIATGTSHMAQAYRDTSKTRKRLMGAGGLLSIIIGVLLVATPDETVEFLHTLSAVQALLIGAIFISVGSYMLFHSRKAVLDGDAATSSPSEEADNGSTN
jgi:uncharacterized membrane protein HdeD (DUF308 family)